MEWVTEYGPAALQLGWFLVSCALGWVCSKLWARLVTLEEERATVLKDRIKEARDDVEGQMKLSAKIVEEQTKTRELLERLERQIERRNGE